LALDMITLEILFPKKIKRPENYSIKNVVFQFSDEPISFHEDTCWKSFLKSKTGILMHLADGDEGIANDWFDAFDLLKINDEGTHFKFKDKIQNDIFSAILSFSKCNVIPEFYFMSYYQYPLLCDCEPMIPEEIYSIESFKKLEQKNGFRFNTLYRVVLI